MIAWFASLSGPVRGALWMVFSSACFAVLAAVVRIQSAEVHPFVIAFVRSASLLLIMLAWKGPVLGRLRTARPGLHLFRAIAGTIAMLSLFMAFSLMPVAEVTALTFTAPLFATAGAALFLGETVRIRRWVATGIGFAGAMVILRPAVGSFDPAALWALTSAVALAALMLSIKSLSRTDSANAIVLIAALLMTPLSGIAAAFVWTTPPVHAWGWLLAAGALSFGVQQGMARAMASADISAVLPFDFARLLFTALVGLIVFAESPDAWTFAGGAMIFAATIYIARREAAQAADDGAPARTPSPPA